MPAMSTKVECAAASRCGPTEELIFRVVADSEPGERSHAKYAVSGKFTLVLADPAMFGKFGLGQAYHVSFTPIELAGG